MRLFILFLIGMGWSNFSHAQFVKHLIIETETGIEEIAVLNKMEKKRFKKNKMYTSYNGSGLITLQGEIKGKLAHGTYAKFDSTRTLLVQGMYFFGEKHEEWKTYHSTGELKTVRFFKKGKQHGKSKVFDTEGELVMKTRYRKGTIKK